MIELKELKDKLNLAMESADKNEISEIIESLNKYKISKFFKKK